MSSNFPTRPTLEAEPRWTRRLSDKILVAFHQACDLGYLDVARQLLVACETAMDRPAPQGRERRRNVETLVAAHERLWLLAHPETEREYALQD